MDEKLVYIGKVIALDDIPDAHFIQSATVVCGEGGKWRGVVRKGDFFVNDECVVYLPDSIVPPSEEMKFLEKHKWRVRMCRFRGAPSEVVIMPYTGQEPIGRDMTYWFGVTKHVKSLPLNMQGKAIGEFPSFIPKTDEPNYQTVPELVEMLKGKPYYITEKLDGSSTTAYKYKGHFGVCSRNWELEKDPNNAQWSVAIKHNLEENLPEGYAVQWETCGPKIQGNPLNLKTIEGFVFSGYKIPAHRYLTIMELSLLMVDFVKMEIVKTLDMGTHFNEDDLPSLAEGKYDSGKEREGIVIRSYKNLLDHKPISFKVINLNYED